MTLPQVHTASRIWLVSLLALLLFGCADDNPIQPESPPLSNVEVTTTPEAETIAEATSAAPPDGSENTPTPVAETQDTATPETVQADPTMLTESLAATVPLRTDSSTEGFDGISAFAVPGIEENSELWVAHTYGMRLFTPDEIPHFVALFDDIDGAWIELARIELDCADYVDASGVNRAEISDDALWLTVDGGAGAHSGCFDLLRWDGAAFVNRIQGFNSSPGAGQVTDIDGDGQNEVVLNGTDPYVFCYACGVRLYAAQILRWDGTQLTPVSLTLLPDDAPTEVRESNNRAVALANADLYHLALPVIEEAVMLAPDNVDVYWNAQEIRLYAENRLAYVDGGYPILSYVFYGDYAAAVDLMREVPAGEIFSLDSPLIVGTPAEAWVPELSQYLISFADRAIEVEPEIAEAYFLRAWGRYLADPSDPSVADDLAQAAQLAPEDSLIQAASEAVAAQ